MGIVTKFGDKGKTSLLGGETVSKSNLRVEAYGSVDELNSFIGLAISFSEKELFVKELIAIQNDLHLIESHLALSKNADEKIRKIVPPFSEERIKRTETLIQKIESEIPPLNKFILYGGSKFASALQVSRCIARRAERRVVELGEKEEIEENILIYLNRLSDLLFVMARAVNHHLKIKEQFWTKE
ncbi:MAG: cob(I)yrinic acid a,c-diamide adenosyltransferase [Acidobacteriota bacterium]|nr:cob(I)yrinic acid a,c-diamide adenosyltransferase [Thermoanaerobaculaceae bacterium]